MTTTNIMFLLDFDINALKGAIADGAVAPIVDHLIDNATKSLNLLRGTK